jgi:hypothetical protein
MGGRDSNPQSTKGSSRHSRVGPTHLAHAVTPEIKVARGC